MKRLSWIITLPLMVVAVVFAIFNRKVVDLDLWPLAIKVQAPLFVLVLGSAVVGLLAGAMAAWISGGPTRRRAREARRHAADLEREIARLREVAAPRPAAGTASVLPAVPPPTHTETGSGPRTSL
jgi:uncharacterized integral membrane protein